MKWIGQFLPLAVLISLALGMVWMFFLVLSAFGERSCDWTLSAEAWEDTNGNGIRDGNEAPLENVAIAAYYTWPGNADKFPRVQGAGQTGQVTLLNRPFGYCPQQIRVAVYSPAGYTPTTPDQVQVTAQSTTSISFGFRKQPGFTPIGYPVGEAQCNDDRYRYSGAITGVVVLSNGDIWISSKLNGGVTLRRDGEDYWQDIPYFGSYAEDIAAAPDGSIWVAGGLNAGVAHLVGTTWKTYTIEYGALPSNDVRHVAVTRDGHVWALTSAGLADFNPVSGRWRNQSSLGAGFLLLNSADGMIWLVGNDALTRFQSQSPRDTARRIPINFNSASFVDIWNAAVASDDSIWLVGQADGWPIIAHYDPLANKWTNYTYRTTGGSMPPETPDSIGPLSDGSVLVSFRERGVFRLIAGSSPENAQWVTYPSLMQSKEGYFRHSSIVAIQSDSDIWFSDWCVGCLLRCQIGK